MIKIGQIILFTKDKLKLSSFLSELLDLEIESESDILRLVNEDMSYLIIENPRLAIAASNVMLDFQVNSVQELKEFQKKIEFLYYRAGQVNIDQKTLNVAVPQIKDLGETQFFFFADTDARRWKVSYIVK